VFDTKIKPLLSEYCGRCHGPDKQKGDLNLMRFDSPQKAIAEQDVWATVAERVEAGEMPPEKSKQPTAAERDTLLAWVHSFADEKVDPAHLTVEQERHFFRGHAMGRRLNRTEYANTVRDLIGIDAHPADALPADGSGGEGFDNDGDALFVSDLLLENYLDAARKIADAVIADEPTRLRLGFTDASRATVKTAIANLARRAFRRPVTDAEIERLLRPFDNAANRGETNLDAMKLPIAAVFVSPNFLFLSERQPAMQGLYRIDDYALASKLSYFLWSSMPDEELFTLAAQNRLHEPEVLKAQLRRMIASPKSIALAENFAGQWLGLDELGVSSTPGRRKFPEWNDQLKEDEKREVVLFFDAIVRQDRSLLELLDCNSTYLNEGLAKLYNIPGVTGDQFRRVTLSADSHRGGVLGMAAILTTTSFPLRTSPVLRGRWVMQNLLGSKVPPPPPNTPFLPKNDAVKNGLTFRQQLEKHRSNPACASCHAKMDPLGFGLDNFDPIGRWRSEIDGKPVDASGELPGGISFTGPEQLKQLLLKRKTEFLRTLSRKMMGYALGRGVNPLDLCTVQEAVDAMQQDGCKPSALLEKIVLSRSFQYRYAEK
jgi:hypothetical protein